MEMKSRTHILLATRWNTLLLFWCLWLCAVLLACSQQKASSSAVPTLSAASPLPSAAPDVAVQTLEGDTVRLSSVYAKQPLVLLVYRGVGCPMCVMNLQKLSQYAARIRGYGWNVVALSNDSPQDNREALARSSLDSGFVQSGGFEILLYSDIHHRAMEQFQCYRRDLDTERHGIFLIDQRGTLRFAAIDRRPFEDYEQLMDSLRAIRF